MPRAKKETLTPEQENKKVKDEWLAKPIDVQPNISESSESTDGKKNGLVDRFTGMFSNKEEGVDQVGDDDNGFVDPNEYETDRPEKPPVDMSSAADIVGQALKSGESTIDRGKLPVRHMKTRIDVETNPTNGKIKVDVDRKQWMKHKVGDTLSRLGW
jgi:hypothetical protein